MRTRDLRDPEARSALSRGEAVELTGEDGSVVARVSHPGPAEPDPIDRVRALLREPPTPTRRHIEQALAGSGHGAFARHVQLLALVEAIREVADGA